MGKKLLNIRKRLNLTQAALAEKLRVARRTYQDWERGIHRPPASALMLIELIQQGKL